MQSHEEGQYVEWRDYQWLLTEKQRLDNNCDYLDQKLDEEIEKSAMLCGQVERLTKAGDAVCESPYLWETDPAVIEWRAAKEGKQS
jgi:hypothetical protein